MKEEQLELFDPSAMSVDHVLEELSPDMRNDSRSWPALLAEMVDVTADYLEGLSQFDQETSLEMAQNVIVTIAHHLGGRSIYLPRDDRLKRAIRDMTIYRAFNGSNHLELARKTNLTTTQRSEERRVGKECRL